MAATLNLMADDAVRLAVQQLHMAVGRVAEAAGVTPVQVAVGFFGREGQRCHTATIIIGDVDGDATAEIAEDLLASIGDDDCECGVLPRPN